jgi:hypothetical protein
MMGMAATPAIELRPRGVGELLDASFSVYRRHFLALLGTALVVYGPLTALSLVSSGASLIQLAGTLSYSDMTGDPDALMTTALLAAAVSMCASGLALLAGVLAPWMGGALTYSVIERVLGRTPDWRAAYRATAPRWGSLWVANLVRQLVLSACAVPAAIGLYGVLFSGMAVAFSGPSVPDGAPFGAATLLGLMVVCLPIGVLGLALGAWTAVSWSVSEPAIVGEGAGAFQSLSRSTALVAGLRWRMLGRLLIFWIMQVMVVSVPIFLLQMFLLGGALVASEGGDLSPATLAGYLAASVFGVAAGVLLAPLNVIYVTMNYLDLRVRKEQLDLQLRVAQALSKPQ